jgi:drug/metabolite transporter (DMT)-like permease
MGLWASCFPLIAVGLSLAPHLAFAALRAAIAGVALLIVAALLRRPMPLDPMSWGQIAILAFAATSLGFLGMFHGAAFLSPGLATLIFNTQPLAAALLARILLGKRLGAAGVAGLLIGFTGIAVASWPGLVSKEAPLYVTGAAYVIAAAIGTALGNVVMKSATRRFDAAVAVGLSLTLGAIPLALASAATEDWAFAWSREFVLVLAALSLLGTAVAFWLWFETLKSVPLSQANAFTFLVPLFGLALGAWFFAERIGPFEIGGAALVLLGVGVAQYGSREGSRATAR